MSELLYQVDILKAMNQKLSQKEKMYRTVMDTVDGAILYYSFETGELASLGCWKKYFGFEIQDLREMQSIFECFRDKYELDLRDVLFLENSGKEQKEVECQRRNSGEWFSVCTSVIYDEMHRPSEKIIHILDITKRKNQNDELTYFAYYDSMTGLYNRNHFIGCLSRLIEKAKANNDIISVLMLDIDDFHKINDGLGIVQGDEVVQLFGGVIKQFCNDKVIACHLNSDRYAVAIYQPDDKMHSELFYQRIKERNEKPYVLSDGHEVYMTVSMGSADFPEAADNALELLNCAEITVLKGKATTKNCIHYFDVPLYCDFKNNIEIENKLKEAIFNRSFQLVYQPQYFADTKKLRGVEALIRWKDNEERMISPGVFIPIAEKNGSILTIGNWVLEESIRQFASWQQRFSYDFVMSINISAKQYVQHDFVDVLMGLLEKYHVDPTKVELEITESVLIDDFDLIIRKMNELQEKGIRISLDDFGTGFSSLSYLKRLPINTLKIDKSFIDTVLTDSATRIITESIIDMVKSLGFESVAEGVEEEQQYRYLHAIGCDIIQGFLLGRPLSVEKLDELLKEQNQ